MILKFSMAEIEDKGVCRLSVVPVRESGSDAAEMVTQLLFGDHYTVLEVDSDGKWLKIKIYFDSYEGWIDIKQHYPISNEYFDQINVSDYKISLDLTSTILFKKRNIDILIGSILPLSNSELFKVEEQLAYNGESKSLGQRREFEYMRAVLKKYKYAPYLWGGKTPFGIDCSGFVQMVFKICGYKLKRDARDQVHQGVIVASLEEAQPGDLVFFSKGERINHVGIYLGDQKIMHASGHVREDLLTDQGIVSVDNNTLSHSFHSIRRVIK